MKNIEKIKPSGIFTNYIYKAIPLAFDESMSYYETLCGVLNLLKDQEIIVNNNADALKELQDYVTHYFDNLDVQKEINNKLDQMAKDGTLAEIIAQYLELKGVLSFNSLNDLKNAENIVDGSSCYILGENSYNDGKCAFYKIRTITSQDTIDEFNIISLSISNTLIGERLPNYYVDNLKIYITPEMFGCVGDGITDDTTNFQECVTYAKEHNMCISASTNKIYLINSTIDVSNLYINLNHATIKTNSIINILEVDTTTGYTNIENIIFDCNNIASCGLLLTNSRRSKYNNLDFINVHDKAISTLAGYENMFDNINITTTANNNNAIGFNIETGDNHYTNICMTNIKTAFYITAPGGVYDKIHCWIGDANLIDGSVMFKLNLRYESYMLMTNIYNDTYQIAFKFENATAQYLFLDKFSALYHTGFYTSDKNDSYIFYGLNSEQINNTRITNSLINGLPNNKSHLSNFNFYGYIENSVIANENYNKISEIQNISERISNVRVNEVIDNGNTVTINFIGEFDSTLGSGDYIQIIPLGTLPYDLAPKTRIIGECYITTSYWDYYSTQGGYLFIDANQASNQIQARVPRNNSGTNYLHINITYPKP